MADNKPWCKLWFAEITSEALLDLPPAERWCWAALRSYASMHGRSGSLEISPRNEFLALAFGCRPDEVLPILRRLARLEIEESAAGKIKLSWTDWEQSQSDGRSGKVGLVKRNGSWIPEAENAFANLLRELDIEFETQKRFPYAKTFFTVDFYIPEKKLAFEIQGPSHSSKKYRELDLRKKRFLNDCHSIAVAYVSNTSILQDPEFTKRYVIECIGCPSNASTASNVEESRSRVEKKEKENTPPPTPPRKKRAKAADAEQPALDYDESWAEEAWPSVRRFVALYNASAPDEWPSVESVPETRCRKIREYIAKFPKQQFWETVYQQAKGSKFARVYKNAGMDWLLQRGKNDGIENCVKMFEGKYAD